MTLDERLGTWLQLTTIFHNIMNSRRRFLKAAGASAASAPWFPNIIAANKTNSKLAVVGEGEYRYECHHAWGAIPEHIKWNDTHGTAVDSEGLVYIKHRGSGNEPMDTIVVFEPETGKFVRSFGKAYWGGGHGIDIRKDGDQEFLYICDTRHGVVAKMTLRGEQVWAMSFPEASGFYASEKSNFSPTNVAFSPDGGFYVADGYGSDYIHQYDENNQWVRSWGGTGERPGTMKTPHSIWLDDRPGRDPSLVVADRANARLQYFTLEGAFKNFVEEVSFPADFDTQGDVLLVPDLHARITLFDKYNKVITHLGYSQEWTDKALDNFKMRSTPSMWEDGRFVHPHDACFDKAGNIYVAEWVAAGRVSFLKKLN